MKPADPQTIDAYIAAQPPAVRGVLKKIRAAIRKAAPRAEERMSYRMPTFWQGRILVHVGAFTSHVGLFPPVTDPALRAAVAPYAGPKRNLRFPLDRPIPYALIARIVKSRLREVTAQCKPAVTRRTRRS